MLLFDGGQCCAKVYLFIVSKDCYYYAFIMFQDDVGHSSMLASVELKKRENRDDLDFLQMNGYVPCSIYSI
jgi:hypothetical protein